MSSLGSFCIERHCHAETGLYPLVLVKSYDILDHDAFNLVSKLEKFHICEDINLFENIVHRYKQK